MDDRAQMQLLGGQGRKALREVKPHLIPKDRACAGAGAIATVGAVFHHMLQEIEILLHGRCLPFVV